MAIKAIIWDMGGVLLRTEDYTLRDQLAAELGVTREHLEKAVFSGDIGQQAQLGKISVAELWEAVGQEYSLTAEELIRFDELFWGGDVLDRTLIDRIRSLQEKYHTGLLSNAWLDLRVVITDRWKIDDAFDMMTISAEEGIMKPDARIYQIAAARANAAPSEVVFIDDFPHNIQGAEAIGMHGILFQSRGQILAALDTMLK
ncbi:MAG: HAD family phosphatase [Chloroflexota bacterium]